MTAQEVVADLLEKPLGDHKQAIRLSNEIINALDLAGWHTTEDAYLATLRVMLRRVVAVANDPDTPARDLASLSRQVQQLSKEVAALEEKERQEKPKGSTNGQSGTAGSTSEQFDPTKA
jgi:polyhydroxyalkanoate synthesis regulator phasin